MSKARNVALICIVFALLCATLGLKALYRLDIPLPEALGESNEKSYLEGKSYQKHPEFSLQSFREGTLQDELEDYLADAVPCRDNILLANAALQRLGISQAAALFNFSAYPTFYGSDYAYLPDEQVVCAISTQFVSSKYTYTAEALEGMIKENPNLNFYLYVPARQSTAYHISSSNLVSNPEIAEDVSACLGSIAGDGLTVIDSGADTFESYNEAFYSTDHHWNIVGAYQAYEDIMNVIGNGDAIARPMGSLVFDEPAFYGSQARSGLCVSKSDLVVDYTFDLPTYTVSINGEDVDAGALDHYEAYMAGDYIEATYANRYGEYYHKDYAEIVIRSAESRSGKGLLLIGDSYSSCIERLFLSAYDVVYVVDPRQASFDLNSYLQDKPEISDVLVLDCAITLQSWGGAHALG